MNKERTTAQAIASMFGDEECFVCVENGSQIDIEALCAKKAEQVGVDGDISIFIFKDLSAIIMNCVHWEVVES